MNAIYPFPLPGQIILALPLTWQILPVAMICSPRNFSITLLKAHSISFIDLSMLIGLHFLFIPPVYKAFSSAVLISSAGRPLRGLRSFNLRTVNFAFKNGTAHFICKIKRPTPSTGVENVGPAFNKPPGHKSEAASYLLCHITSLTVVFVLSQQEKVSTFVVNLASEFWFRVKIMTLSPVLLALPPHYLKKDVFLPGLGHLLA